MSSEFGWFPLRPVVLSGVNNGSATFLVSRDSIQLVFDRNLAADGWCLMLVCGNFTRRHVRIDSVLRLARNVHLPRCFSSVNNHDSSLANLSSPLAHHGESIAASSRVNRELTALPSLVRSPPMLRSALVPSRTLLSQSRLGSRSSTRSQETNLM